VIVKKVRKTIPAPMRGSWKIAYADFVTAMLAFFLLMWLTSAVSHKDLLAISDYFKITLVEYAGGKNNDETISLISSDYGDDKKLDSGQVAQAAKQIKKISVPEAEARRLMRLEEVARLQSLKLQLELLIDSDPKLRQFKNQLLIDMTTEGLRILIVDAHNRPMFELGSAVLQPYTVEILQAIGNVLNQVPNKIGLSGHTDAAPYPGNGAGYSNWELSMDRANASRRELSIGGLDASKVLRVVGLSSSALFNPRDPYDANNRRISIIVMNRETAESVNRDGEQ
jgi:chemotaxis protein MotB